MSSYLKQLWQSLTQPSAGLRNSESRRRARLLAALLVLQIIVSVPVYGSRHLFDDSYQSIANYVLGAFILLLIAYVLSRTVYYIWGSALYIGAIFITVFAIMLNNPTTNPDRVLGFLVLVVLLSSLLFSVKATAISAAASIIGILLLPLLVTDMAELYAPLGFTTIMSVLIFVASVIRRYDVEQMKLQSLALSESEQRYRSLMDASSEAIMIFDEGRLLDANSAFERVFGYGLNDALGRPAVDFVPREEHILLQKRLSQQSSEPFETTALRKDKQTLPVEMVCRVHQYKGGGAQVLLVRDLTEHKGFSLEKERVAVLRRFISDASHDLRTPLTNLKTSTYLLKRLGSDPEKQKHHLEVIEKQTTRLERLLADLLMMSRLDAAATGEFQFGFTDLNEFVAEIIEKHQALAALRNHTINFEPDPSVKPILLDRTKIPIAIGNLLINAYNYTSPGGEIAIRTFTQNQQVGLSVQDNGIGIEPEDLEHVFDSFFRADKARGADTGGAGLGLAISKRIIEAHHGTIQVQSTPNVGSTFTVTFPIISQPTPRSSAQPIQHENP